MAALGLQLGRRGLGQALDMGTTGGTGTCCPPPWAELLGQLGLGAGAGTEQIQLMDKVLCPVIFLF